VVTRYDLLRLLHIVGAIAWVGGGLGLLVLHRQLARVRDHATLAAIGRQSQALGNRLFVPASLATVGFGIALVATEDAFRFGDLWILIGFGGIVASGVAQSVLVAPAGKRFLALMDDGGDQAELSGTVHRMTLGDALDVIVLLVVVVVMVLKPTL
jgi:uncharacterized membrane protein